MGFLLFSCLNAAVTQPCGHGHGCTMFIISARIFRARSHFFIFFFGRCRRGVALICSIMQKWDQHRMLSDNCTRTVGSGCRTLSDNCTSSQLRLPLNECAYQGDTIMQKWATLEPWGLWKPGCCCEGVGNSGSMGPAILLWAPGCCHGLWNWGSVCNTVKCCL